MAPDTPARRYLRYLAHCAHEAGLPYLPINDLSPRQVHDWIEYLRGLIAAHERVEELLHEQSCQVREGPSSPYLQTPPTDQLPEEYMPPWQDLPDAFDHEHLVDNILREDDIEESVCVVCGVSA